MSKPNIDDPEVSLVLPAYNEQDNIVNVLTNSAVQLDAICKNWEILVIDNASTDNTPKVVSEGIRKEPRIRLIVHDSNRLYSGSCATAIQEARGKYIAIMDSDGQCTAADLPEFITRLQAGANLVFGWRRKRHDPFFRLVTSLMFNILGKMWLGYPFHDFNCGFRMFDRSFRSVAKIRYKINMANPELYIRAKQAGMKLDEVEIRHFKRYKGVASHNFFRLWEIFLEVNKYMMELRKELKG